VIVASDTDNLNDGLAFAPFRIRHNGTAWPARTTVTSDLTHPVDWVGPAPLPTDFQTGPDMLYDTSAQATATSAAYRVAGHPLTAPLPNAGVIPWQGTTASWTAPAAAQTVTKADTTVTLAGDSSYTLLTKGDNAFISGVNATQTSFNLTANPGYSLSVWIWVSDPTRVASMSVYASSSSGNSYYWDLLLAAPTADKPVLFPNRWRKFTLSTGFANVQGAPVATALNRVVFNINDIGGGAGGVVTARISNRMEWEPGSSALFPNGVVSFDFDDCYSSVKTAIPLLGQHGWRASLVPILSLIGSGGSLTWADIKEIQGALGWPVKSHCRYLTTPVGEHNGFTTLTESQMIDAISGTRDAIAGQGLYGSEDWGAANGAYGTGVETKMVCEILAPYIRSARITQSRRSVDTLPPGDRYMLAARSDVGGPSLAITNYTAAAGILDQVVASKGWAHITLHDIIPSGTAANNQITIADFTTLLTSIATKNIAVYPTAEVLEALR
jgi:hypothetical protein